MIIPAVVLDLQASETTLADLGGRGFTEALGEGGKPENQAGRGGTQAEAGVQTQGAVPGGPAFCPRPHALLSDTPARCLLLKRGPEAGGKQGWLSGAGEVSPWDPGTPFCRQLHAGKQEFPQASPWLPGASIQSNPSPREAPG